MPAASRQSHIDVVGFIYSGLGVIYAVLLALVVIAVWEEHKEASSTVEQEANAVAEVFWLAHRLPEPEGPHLQELARSYAREVVVEEWLLMEREQGTAAGWTLIDDIRASVQQGELRRPTGSSVQKGWTRSSDSRMPGGCVWSRRRRASPASFGRS